MIIGDFLKAIAQFDDKRFRRVLWRGIGLTIALLIGAYALFLMLLSYLGAAEWIDSMVGGVTWVGSFLTFGSFFLMIIFSIFLMIPVASFITSLFLDEVAQAVEARHYPNLPPARNMPIGESIKDTLNFLGVLIGANILALILSLFFPFLLPFIFWAVNGYLLGREYFFMAAVRRHDRAQAKALFQKYRGRVWIAGMLMAVPLTIPFLNLLIPIIGAATFTHQFQRLQGLPSD